MIRCNKRRWFVIAFILWTTFSPRESFSANNKKKLTPSRTSTLSAPAKPTAPAVSVPRYPDPSIIEIQKQLQDIIKVHQDLEKQRNQDLAEIQKILEQSRMHQQLLSDLNRDQTAAGKAKSEMDEIIRRQKIQIIEEQALKNKSELEKLKKKSPPAKK